MFPHHRTCHHAVLFYKDDASVRDGVSAYISGALREGDPALVIARPQLVQHLRIEVHRQHVQGAPFGPQRGVFVLLDAAATLESICAGGSPDGARFDEVVGGELARLGAGGKRVAAYGEMVGLLCERGQYADAIRVEGMWNRLLESAHASLFCGYSKRLFTSAASRGFYRDIRAAHTQVHEEADALAGH